MAGENEDREEKRGRPSLYTDEVAKEICARLSSGQSLREVCRDESMPHEATVRTWVREDYNGFYTQYTQARELGYHAMADELLEIADDGQNDWMERNADDGSAWEANGEHLQRSRLRVDTRKWMLSKVLPKIYGDKVGIEHSISNDMAERLDAARKSAKL